MIDRESVLEELKEMIDGWQRRANGNFKNWEIRDYLEQKYREIANLPQTHVVYEVNGFNNLHELTDVRKDEVVLSDISDGEPIFLTMQQFREWCRVVPEERISKSPERQTIIEIDGSRLEWDGAKRYYSFFNGSDAPEILENFPLEYPLGDFLTTTLDTESLGRLGRYLFYQMSERDKFIAVTSHEDEGIGELSRESQDKLFEVYMNDDNISGLLDWDLLQDLVSDAGIKEELDKVNEELYSPKQSKAKGV